MKQQQQYFFYHENHMLLCYEYDQVLLMLEIFMESFYDLLLFFYNLINIEYY
jgi:hypothetical protein